MSPDLYWVAVVLTTLIASSRLIRLWTYDDFPPVRWANDRFMDFTERRAPKWSELGFCPWCVGFWITLAVVGTGLWADVYGPGDTPVGNDAPAFMAWWIVMGSLAMSYLSAMLMARDGDTTRDEPDSSAV